MKKLRLLMVGLAATLFCLQVQAQCPLTKSTSCQSKDGESAQKSCCSSAKNRNITYAVFASAGADRSDWAALNDELANSGKGTGLGFEGVNTYAPTASFGIMITMNRIVQQYDATISRQRQTNEAEDVTQLSNCGGSFNFGYSVVQKENFRLYPLVGMSFSLTNLDLTRAVAEDAPFSSLVATDGNKTSLNTASHAAHVGFGADFMPAACGQSGKKLLIGIRAGYNLPFAQTDWKMDEVRLSDGPEINPSQYYVRLTFGSLFSR